jgi:hypothetical protein
MNNYKLLGLALGVQAAAMLAGCGKPTLVERNFGESVRQMVEAQTYDPSTLSNPSTEPVEGGDGQQLENVIGAYRSDVAKPEAVNDDIVINVGGQR